MSGISIWKVIRTRVAKDWIEGLDQAAKTLILQRIERMKGGNFGDCKLLKGHPGLWEARFTEGPGYRFYYGKFDGTIVIVLLGGDKGTQDADILAASAALKWLIAREVEEKAAAADKPISKGKKS